MSRRTDRFLITAVLTAAFPAATLFEAPALAGEHGLFHGHGHATKYDVVQGYIVLPQAGQPAAAPQHVVHQAQQGLASPQTTSAPQLQTPAAPQTQLQTQPQLQLQAQPQLQFQLQAVQAPVVQLQLAQPAPTQMVQLSAAPAQVLQVAAPAPVQTLQLAAAPAPMLQVSTSVHYVQLAAAPAPLAASVATPVTLLLPQKRCLLHRLCTCK